MAEKAGSVTMIVLSIVGFFAILSIVLQQHNIKIKNNDKRASVKRELDTQEWFEFEDRGKIIAIQKSSIDFIERDTKVFGVTLHWAQGRATDLGVDKANELLRFAGLSHLVKGDNERF